MGKKKTLKQKKITDTRRQQTVQTETTSPSSLHTVSYSFSPVPRHTVAPVNIQKTVISDIRKTAFISLSIVAIELVLFTLLQNHVLALPFVRY